MTQHRLTSIDFLRVFAMLGVICIHVTAAYISAESRAQLFGMNLAFLLNQATRFSVPLFLLLSGFALGLGQKPVPYPVFLKRRCLRVLVPYAVWTVLYEIANCGFSPGAWLAALTPAQLGRDLWTGQAAPHLYFIPIIFQFYLLYPLLRRWVDRRPGQSLLWSLAATLFFQGGYYAQSLGLLPAVQVPGLWRFFPVWMFYFVLGMVLRRLDYDRLRDRCRAVAWPLLAVWALFVFLYCLMSRYTGVLDSIKPSIMLFVPLTFFCGVGLWERLRPGPRLTAAVTALSLWSMDIYYSHVMVLRLLRAVPRFQVGMSGMLLLFLGTFLGAALFSALLGWGKKAGRALRRR